MSVLNQFKVSFWLCSLTSLQLAIQYREIAYPEMGSKAPRPHLFAVVYLRLLVSTLGARRENDPTQKVSSSSSCLYQIISRKYHNIIA